MQLRATRLTAIASAAKRFIATFSPSSLFANNEQGVWYDPSDMSTMFQDPAGTTPVTGMEQPVGRILDKSGRGNHATQPTAAMRPVLQARYNLLSNTEAFDSASWLKQGSNVVANSVQAPNGTLTADTVRLNSGVSVTVSALGIFTSGDTSYVSQSTVAALPATNHIFSIYVKAASGLTHAQLRVATNAGLTNNLAAESVVRLSDGAIISGGGTVQNAGNGWWRVSVPFTATAAVYFCGMWLWNSTAISSATGNEGVHVWGADLRAANDGIGLPEYQRVGAATSGSGSTAGNADYDTAGFPPYLRFFGVETWLSTASINFTGTDKMTVFAGVRKLSDAATGAIAELGGNPTLASGTFWIISSAGSTANDIFAGTRGSQYRTGYGFTANAPASGVLSVGYSLSGTSRDDCVKVRWNGGTPVLVGALDLTAGAGSYGNYPIYIGRRAGTSNPFNGRMYSLIVRGAQSTAQQISNTETWVNGKTRAY